MAALRAAEAPLWAESRATAVIDGTEKLAARKPKKLAKPNKRVEARAAARSHPIRRRADRRGDTAIEIDELKQIGVADEVTLLKSIEGRRDLAPQSGQCEISHIAALQWRDRHDQRYDL